MTTYEYRLPDVGEGVAEGELLQWYVEASDRVEEDQVIAEVETDKAAVDIPSPVDGTVSERLYEPGAVVPVGDVFVTFETDGSDQNGSETETAPPSTASDERTFAPPTVRRVARELDVGLSHVEGTGTSGRITEGDVKAAARDTRDGESASASREPPRTELEDSVATSVERETPERDRTLAVPTTRRLAHELSVDINEVPTDEEKRGHAFVTKEAVREFTEADVTDAETAPVKPEERVPYRGVRRTIGEQMTRSKSNIPHVTTVDEADVTDLVERKERITSRAAEQGTKLTYLPFVIKAVGNALQEFPYLNATLDTENDEIVLKNYYNVGVATEGEDGLRVPVVDDVDQKGLLQLAADVNEVTQRARDGTISRDEMQGGTFTITNIGPYGGEHGTPIINYPEAGILAMGRVKKKPRVVDDDIVPRHVVNLSLSFDHRIVDGATAAQFLNAIKEYVETPDFFLLE